MQEWQRTQLNLDIENGNIEGYRATYNTLKANEQPCLSGSSLMLAVQSSITTRDRALFDMVFEDL